MTIQRQEQEQALELPDMDLECTYSGHHFGAPVVWAVWFLPFPVCGHRIREFLLFCDPCWVKRNSASMVSCNTCERVTPASSTIARAERIS